MKTLLTTLAATSVATTAVAQDAKPVASAPLFSAFTVTETVGVYDKKGSADTVTALDTILGVKALGLDWHLAVPVYVSDDAGYGSIELGTSWDALKGVDFLGSKTTVNLEGGLFTPTGSAGYEATNLNPHIGAGALLDWGAWTVSQTADWRFITGGSMYDPLLGTISDDLATLVTGLNYKITDSVKAGVDLGQYYLVGGEGAIMVTPNIKWTAASNVDVSVGVGIPVWQELAVENNMVVNAGVSFKF
jgi:hypothetical protein